MPYFWHDRRVLLVIDNAESLLTGGGEWREARWSQVVGALTAHRGPGRVIRTTRRVPASQTGLRVEAVDVLSADEALMLSRELPHLQALSAGQVPGISRPDGRRLVRLALESVHGHPKTAGTRRRASRRPERLAALLAVGDRAWREQGGLEESDRVQPVLDGTWADLWHRLARTGEPPDLGPALAGVAARGLASIHAGTASCPVHPGVAGAGRAHAGKPSADGLLLTYKAEAVGRGDYLAAAAAAGWLVYLRMSAGRLAEALELAGQQAVASPVSAAPASRSALPRPTCAGPATPSPCLLMWQTCAATSATPP